MMENNYKSIYIYKMVLILYIYILYIIYIAANSLASMLCLINSYQSTEVLVSFVLDFTIVMPTASNNAKSIFGSFICVKVK